MLLDLLGLVSQGRLVRRDLDEPVQPALQGCRLQVLQAFRELVPLAPVGPVKLFPVEPVGPVTVGPTAPVGPVCEMPSAPVGPPRPVGPVAPVRLDPVGPVAPGVPTKLGQERF